MLVEILAESLPLEQLGVYDNLLDLSELTHSAPRVISRVREVFHVDLSLADLLASPSVGALSISIVSKQARELKDEDMALLMEQLEGITEEDAQTMLAD
jgi:hypothetical protein